MKKNQIGIGATLAILAATTAVLATPGSLIAISNRHRVAIDSEFKIKQNGPSDLQFMEVTLQPGGRTGWHSHGAPHFVAVKQGEFTVYHAGECEAEPFAAGTGFVDEGDRHAHMGVATATDVPTIILVLDNPKPGDPVRYDEPDPGAPANCGL